VWLLVTMIMEAIPKVGILHRHHRENRKSSSPIFVTLMMEATRCSETLVLTRATRCNIPEDGILRSHRRENRKYSSSILVMLMMEATRCSETSVLTRSTRRNIPEDGVAQNVFLLCLWVSFGSTWKWKYWNVHTYILLFCYIVWACHLGLWHWRKKEHCLRMFKNRVSRRLLRHNRLEVKACFKDMDNGELQNLRLFPYTVWAMNRDG
jgi:hypothetical protein